MSRKKRRSKLELFQRNAAGEYIYTGGHMRYADAHKTRRRMLAELWASGALGTLCFLAGGFLPVPGFTGCFYVLGPYVAALIAAAGSLWTLGELTGAGDPIRQYAYDATVLRLPVWSMIAGIAGGLCLLGEGLYLIRNGGGLGTAAAFLALEAAGTMAMLLFRGVICRSRWQEN